MLTSCEKHQDTMVVYDTPILASCPLCTMENELYEANDESEKVPDLEIRIETLKKIIIRKEGTADELKTQIDELEKELR